MQSLATTCFMEEGNCVSGVLRMCPAKFRVGFVADALEGA